jgi:hypothetical protein
VSEQYLAVCRGNAKVVTDSSAMFCAGRCTWDTEVWTANASSMRICSAFSRSCQMRMWNSWPRLFAIVALRTICSGVN